MISGYINLPFTIIKAISEYPLESGKLHTIQAKNAFNTLKALSNKPVIAGFTAYVDNIKTEYYGILPIVRNDHVIIIGSTSLHLVITSLSTSPDVITVMVGG